MNGKTIMRAIPSALAALGSNIIPAGIVLVGRESTETAMALYFLENIVAIILIVIRVRLLAPANDEAYRHAINYSETRINGRIVSRRHTPANRRTLIINYLAASLGLSIASGIFLFAFLFLIIKADIPGSLILSGATGIIAFQLFSFVTDLFLLSPLPGSQVEPLLRQSLGRVALLYLAVFAGLFLALLAERWFIWPFAALKTMIDLARSIQIFMEREQALRPGMGEG